MFNRKPISDPRLDDLIDKVYDEMSVETPDEDRYKTMLKNLEDLEKLKRDKENHQKSDLDPNKVLAVVANVAGIVSILSYEQTRVIGSKALGMIFKSI